MIDPSLDQSALRIEQIQVCIYYNLLYLCAAFDTQIYITLYGSNERPISSPAQDAASPYLPVLIGRLLCKLVYQCCPVVQDNTVMVCKKYPQ